MAKFLGIVAAVGLLGLVSVKLTSMSNEQAVKAQQDQEMAQAMHKLQCEEVKQSMKGIKGLPQSYLCDRGCC
jgi:Tfp pilus assembly protein PilV